MKKEDDLPSNELIEQAKQHLDFLNEKIFDFDRETKKILEPVQNQIDVFQAKKSNFETSHRSLEMVLDTLKDQESVRQNIQTAQEKLDNHTNKLTIFLSLFQDKQNDVNETKINIKKASEEIKIIQKKVQNLEHYNAAVEYQRLKKETEDMYVLLMTALQT